MHFLFFLYFLFGNLESSIYLSFFFFWNFHILKLLLQFFYMRKIADISSALSDILKEYDKEIWAEFVISNNWSKIAGKKRKAYSLKLRGGILRISTPDSTLRNFLLNQKKLVLDKINEILGEKMVNDIEVFGISQPIFKMFSQKLKSKEKTKEGE